MAFSPQDTSSSNSTDRLSTSSPAHLLQVGYLLLPAAIPPPQLHRLRLAAAHITALARRGDWPYVRTVPKQFPPWPERRSKKKEHLNGSEEGAEEADEAGIWGVQHLLHPEVPGRVSVRLGPDGEEAEGSEGDEESVDVRKEFASLYFGDVVLDAVKGIFAALEARESSSSPNNNTTTTTSSSSSSASPSSQHASKTDAAVVEDDVLTMELLNLLVRPASDFALRWHRDDIPWACDAETETALLAQRRWHAQYNVALWDDCSLELVPGSHVRARTAGERAVDGSISTPDSLNGKGEGEMPGAVTLQMHAGDIVFYDNNVLHRGVYACGRPRMTVHGSVGHVKAGRRRARNVLQHGLVGWVGECKFNGLGAEGISGKEETDRRLGERAEEMRRRLEEMGRESGDVGFFAEAE